MYFCFDLLDPGTSSSNRNDFQTVAVTCPKKDLPRGTNMQKCCPNNEYLDSTQTKCVNSTDSAHLWGLQINGHFYTHEGLNAAGVFQDTRSTDVSSIVPSNLMKRP